MKLRRFSWDLPMTILEAADRRYLDRETEHEIAVKQVHLRGRSRRLMIAYDRRANVVEIVTIHPIKSGTGKVKSERRKMGETWLKGCRKHSMIVRVIVST